jgi:PIN domain nuclease of toxin-antitoxin system
MTYILDTHTLIWFLAKDSRLGKRAKETLLNLSDIKLVIPAIVLAEVKYLIDIGKIRVNWIQIEELLLGSPDVSFFSIDFDIVASMPSGLEIHDALIVATAKVLEESLNEEVILLSRDEEIASSDLVKTLW